MLTKGEIIKIKESKRVRLEIQDIDTSQSYAHKLILTPIYKPSSKSTLNKKSIFSKVKFKIQKL
jgi:hypothetical protein